MKRIVRLREEADRDLAAAASWYEQQREGLGHEFLHEALSAFQLVAEQPLTYPEVHRNTRRALCRAFHSESTSVSSSPKSLSWQLSMEAAILVAGKVAHNKPMNATCETHARYGRR